MATNIFPPTGSVPTQLTMGRGQGNVITDHAASTQTATITSSSITEVLNLTGPGVVTYLGFRMFSAASDNQVRVTIDGVVVFEDLAFTSISSSGYFLVGSSTSDSSFRSSTEVTVPFNSSLIVEIAAPGSIAALYKTYLT